MDKEIIKEYIEKSNPWWTKEFNIPYYKEREIYKEIQRYLKSKQIVSIEGLRRVGKTTTMKKIIEDKIKEGFSKRNIFYFSFDDFAKIRISEIIKVYEEIIDKKTLKEKFLFVFDEIQKVENWSEQIKRIYDENENIKFIVSGSESLFIKKKSRESLAGRIYSFVMKPLSFKEHLEFKGVRIENVWLQREAIIKEFKKYLITNGFPEIINSEEDIAIKYINESIIEKILYRDLNEVFNIKDPSVIKSLFDIIYNKPGQIIEIQEIAGEIGISRNLASEYLSYLEESYLIKKLYNYSNNARKTQRKMKKYYSTLINPLLIKEKFSEVFEQAIVINLSSEFFWRDAYQNEVDIIKTNPLQAIEIKSGDIKERDLNSIKKFNKKFKPEKVYVLSYNTKKDHDEIKIIPFYEFLLKEKQ